VECVLQPNFRDDPEKLFGGYGVEVWGVIRGL